MEAWPSESISLLLYPATSRWEGEEGQDQGGGAGGGACSFGQKDGCDGWTPAHTCTGQQDRLFRGPKIPVCSLHRPWSSTISVTYKTRTTSNIVQMMI